MAKDPKYSPELIDAACRLWAPRMTYKNLAKALNLSPTQLNYVLNTLGKEILKNYENQYGAQCDRIYQTLQNQNGEGDGAHT